VIATGGSAAAPSYSLWRFSLACVPADKTIVSATVKWMVYQDTGRSVNQFDLYELKRAWSERSATWVDWSTGAPWTKPGAADVADRDTTVAGSIDAGAADVAAGSWVLARLNANGVAALQRWRAGTRDNAGFLLKPSSGTDTLRVLSSETGASAKRPRLEVTYKQ
jgi:hypothetical protein